MPRKRTKAEALERLSEAASVSRGFKGKPKVVRDAALLGAAGLIMLDPFNRLADERIVIPVDMICIPAYQAYMLQGTPSMTIYVRAGETIIPTGGNVRDVEEAMEDLPEHTLMPAKRPNLSKARKSKTAYQRKYKRAFKEIAPRHKLKNGKWKKGGFKAAVKAAHKKAKGMK